MSLRLFSLDYHSVFARPLSVFACPCPLSVISLSRLSWRLMRLENVEKFLSSLDCPNDLNKRWPSYFPWEIASSLRRVFEIVEGRDSWQVATMPTWRVLKGFSPHYRSRMPLRWIFKYFFIKFQRASFLSNFLLQSISIHERQKSPPPERSSTTIVYQWIHHTRRFSFYDLHSHFNTQFVPFHWILLVSVSHDPNIQGVIRTCARLW